MTNKTLEAIADSIETFWNAAIGDAHRTQSEIAMAVASALSEGYAAVALRLREHAANDQEEAVARWVKTSERQPTVGGSYITGDWCETGLGMPPHFRKDMFNFVIIDVDKGPTWYSSLVPKNHGSIDQPQYWLEGLPKAPEQPSDLKVPPNNVFDGPAGAPGNFDKDGNLTGGKKPIRSPAVTDEMMEAAIRRGWPREVVEKHPNVALGDLHLPPAADVKDILDGAFYAGDNDPSGPAPRKSDIEVSITPPSSVVGRGLTFRRKDGPTIALMTLLRAQANDDYGALADEILPRIVRLWNGDE